MVSAENRRFIVEPSDPAALADALATLTGDAALRARVGAANRARAAAEYDETAMIAAYAAPLALAWDEAGALEWAKRRGARSGRTAWQFVTELAGRAGRPT